jgi:hypothetical protein
MRTAEGEKGSDARLGLSFVKATLTGSGVKVTLTKMGSKMAFKLKRRALKCSFCRKMESQVQRLVGGPNVAICDACIGICNRILEATPAPFSGWEKMSDEQLLQSLKPASQAMEAVRNLLQEQVEMLRKRDVSWAQIGEALDISRQAAWERFS